MTKKRTTVSIADKVREMANDCMDARGFSDFTSYLEQLIRDDHERRQGQHTLKEPSPGWKPTRDPKTPAKPHPKATGKRAARQ